MAVCKPILLSAGFCSISYLGHWTRNEHRYLDRYISDSHRRWNKYLYSLKDHPLHHRHFTKVIVFIDYLINHLHHHIHHFHHLIHLCYKFVPRLDHHVTNFGYILILYELFLQPFFEKKIVFTVNPILLILILAV